MEAMESRRRLDSKQGCDRVRCLDRGHGPGDGGKVVLDVKITLEVKLKIWQLWRHRRASLFLEAASLSPPRTSPSAASFLGAPEGLGIVAL